MYRKSFFMVMVTLLLMGILFAGTRIVSAIPGISHTPSVYDPKVSIVDAVRTSDRPLLIEFYSDSCPACQTVTPWMHNLSAKYRPDLKFVMINMDDPQQSQIADIFGVQFIPAVFIFDFKHMHKVQVDEASYSNQDNVDLAIAKALKDVRQKAAAGSSPLGNKSV